MKTNWALMAAIAGLLAAPSALATPYDTLQSIAGSYNMFLLGNLGTASSPYTADMQGPVAVAGNAYLSNVAVDSYGSGAAGLVVGGNLQQTGGSDGGNVFVGGNASISNGGGISNIAVGGSLTAQGGQISGNVFVGGAATNLSGGVTISGSLNVTGANSTLNAASNGGSSPQGVYVTASTQVNDPSYWTRATVGGGPATPSAPLDVFGSSTDIVNASKSLAALSGTSVISSGGVLTITLTGNGLNIVNLTIPNGATITGINIVNANGVTPTGLVLNVNGDNLNFNGGSFNLGSLSTSNVLFNFTNATTLNLSSLAFEGALLAPLATVNFSNGHIDGALIANNYIGNAQLNDVPLNDPLPVYTPVGGSGGTVASAPEPGALFIFGTGLIGIALLRRRGVSVQPG